VHPVRVKGGRYLVPQAPGYSAEIKPGSLERFGYPDGDAWAAVEHPMAEGSSMTT
jgi:L-fuconate dehydratase